MKKMLARSVVGIPCLFMGMVVFAWGLDDAVGGALKTVGVGKKDPPKCKIPNCNNEGEDCFGGKCRTHQGYHGPCYICGAYRFENEIEVDRKGPVCRSCLKKKADRESASYMSGIKKIDEELASKEISKPLGKYWIGETNEVGGVVHDTFDTPLLGIFDKVVASYDITTKVLFEAKFTGKVSGTCDEAKLQLYRLVKILGTGCKIKSNDAPLYLNRRGHNNSFVAEFYDIGDSRDAISWKCVLTCKEGNNATACELLVKSRKGFNSAVKRMTSPDAVLERKRAEKQVEYNRVAVLYNQKHGDENFMFPHKEFLSTNCPVLFGDIKPASGIDWCKGWIVAHPDAKYYYEERRSHKIDLLFVWKGTNIVCMTFDENIPILEKVSIIMKTPVKRKAVLEKYKTGNVSSDIFAVSTENTVPKWFFNRSDYCFDIPSCPSTTKVETRAHHPTGAYGLLIDTLGIDDKRTYDDTVRIINLEAVEVVTMVRKENSIRREQAEQAKEQSEVEDSKKLLDF